jgi:thioredoxin reductase (NADPH)
MTAKHDVVIIGAGPAGLAAAIYAGRARLDTVVLEKGLPGGQILITDWVENYPGFPDGIAPFDLIETFRKQVLKFGAVIVSDGAKSIRPDGDGPDWIVQAGKTEYATRAVIVATGAHYRRLGLPNEGKLVGRGVSYCATCDGAFFRDREIAVVGGGDTALMEAHYLTKFASKIHVIHRRDRFRGAKILQERLLESPTVDVHWNSVVDEIVGSDCLEAIVLCDVATGAKTTLPVEGFFVAIGMDPVSDVAKGLLELNAWGEIVVNPRMATSRPGIYAAGDVISSMPRQVATAVGSGVNAAMGVSEYLSGYK